MKKVRFDSAKVLVLALITSALLANSAFSSPQKPTAPTEKLSATQSLADLKAGNQRYSTGRPKHPHEGVKRLQDTALHGQHPKAVVLGCADSRVSPELLFDQGVGDIFDVRVAGNVANKDELASMEYAVGHLHTPLIVVLGHTKCGAVTAVASGEYLPGPNLNSLAVHITDAVNAVKKTKPELKGDPLVAASIEANVQESLEDIYQGSEALRSAIDKKEVLLVGAVYDLKTGQIQWLPAYAPKAK